MVSLFRIRVVIALRKGELFGCAGLRRRLVALDPQRILPTKRIFHVGKMLIVGVAALCPAYALKSGVLKLQRKRIEIPHPAVPTIAQPLARDVLDSTGP